MKRVSHRIESSERNRQTWELRVYIYTLEGELFVVVFNPVAAESCCYIRRDVYVFTNKRSCMGSCLSNFIPLFAFRVPFMMARPSVYFLTHWVTRWNRADLLQTFFKSSRFCAHRLKKKNVWVSLDVQKSRKSSSKLRASRMNRRRRFLALSTRLVTMVCTIFWVKRTRRTQCNEPIDIATRKC